MLTVQPLTPPLWPDLESLFGPRGACCGCWCMYWRLPRKQFDQQAGEPNRQSMQALVKSGNIPGLLAYQDGVSSGWCCVAPREEFPTLARSRVLKPVDEQPVWSVVCFFIARSQRRKGLTVQLLQAAVEYARTNGAKIVEGYPVEPRAGKTADAFAYTGLFSAFLRAGFTEVARRSVTRPIMRYFL
jgi:GNAT superfamily N-acetyltransferase